MKSYRDTRLAAATHKKGAAYDDEVWLSRVFVSTCEKPWWRSPTTWASFIEHVCHWKVVKVRLNLTEDSMGRKSESMGCRLGYLPVCRLPMRYHKKTKVSYFRKKKQNETASNKKLGIQPEQ